MNGRLLPVGWAKFLWWKRKIEGCRVFALGVKPEHQHLGIAAAFYIEHIENAKQPGGIWWGEMGWILETNEPMNRAMEGMGGKIVKRYRIFEKGSIGARRPAARLRIVSAQNGQLEAPCRSRNRCERSGAPVRA